MHDDLKIDFHKFVDKKLAENNFRILPISKNLMNARLNEIMGFVNNIRREYKNLYRWNEEPRDYFLNGLVDKWKFSFTIINDKEEICFLNFSSVYTNIIHNHCTYARKDTRNFNFAKYHMIKLCQTAIDNGFPYQEGYWPKNNNGSIILFLKMGWEIQSIRKDTELFMKADNKRVRDRAYELLTTY